MGSNASALLITSLPLVSPEEVIGEGDLLVVAPHPDDESLGCGGILAWAAANDKRPRVLFVTDGEQSHRGSELFPSQQLARVRRNEARLACTTLGLPADTLDFLSLPDSGLTLLNEAQLRLAQLAVRNWVKQSPQAIVCVPAETDSHSDHVATYNLVKQALMGCANVRVFSYPVWTWVDGAKADPKVATGTRIDITAFLNVKRRAILAYQSQHGELIHDATEAFVLPEALLSAAAMPYEVLFNVDL